MICIGILLICSKKFYLVLKELENAIKEMDGKTVQGPQNGPAFKIQACTGAKKHPTWSCCIFCIHHFSIFSLLFNK